MAGIEVIDSVDAATRARFDLIIDARSPAEFAEDHVPGAINLPVLSNAQRAEIGTIYVQQDKFRGRRLGAALIARNVADHLEGPLADLPPASRVLVYCWRGGQRSHAMATILAQVGWRTGLLHGGYKTYRRQVQERLYGSDLGLRFVLLDGPTGVGKTRILAELAERGVQVLDLEGLARHRGSLLGGLPGQPQPGQKLFESELLQAIESLDRNHAVVVEAESSRIGELIVPPALWGAMGSALRIRLSAPEEARAHYLIEAYGDIIAEPETLQMALNRLPPRLGAARIAEWRELAESGEVEALALALMQRHYDPAYRRSAREDDRPLIGEVEMAALGPDDLSQAADAIVAILAEAREPSLADKLQAELRKLAKKRRP
ncbi:MAG: tRNA 2-selenouridine(34) synthase MnmH [Proteobacteria bacterium]|nr:tRNA 2-selenouridine(34) synthase MnmH [Pseudomonadota bacterium]